VEVMSEGEHNRLELSYGWRIITACRFLPIGT